MGSAAQLQKQPPGWHLGFSCTGALVVAVAWPPKVHDRGGPLDMMLASARLGCLLSQNETCRLLL